MPPGFNDVTLEKYHPEGSTYSVNSERGGLLVLSEVHYPVGWTATVDGERSRWCGSITSCQDWKSRQESTRCS